VENEGKKFLQNIVKDEDNTNVQQIPPTVAPPLVSTSAQLLNTPDNEIQNEDPDFILISKVNIVQKFSTSMNEMKIKLGFHEKLVEQKTNGKSIDSQKGNRKSNESR
jgi:hypothetical protein